MNPGLIQSLIPRAIPSLWGTGDRARSQANGWEEAVRKGTQPVACSDRNRNSSTPRELGASLVAVGKESACSAGDLGLIPGLGRSAGEGIGYPFQYSWASLVAQLVQNPPQCGRPGFDLWVGKIPWRRERLPSSVFWPGEFHGVAKSWTRLSDFPLATFKYAIQYY